MVCCKAGDNATSKVELICSLLLLVAPVGEVASPIRFTQVCSHATSSSNTSSTSCMVCELLWYVRLTRFSFVLHSSILLCCGRAAASSVVLTWRKETVCTTLLVRDVRFGVVLALSRA